MTQFDNQLHTSDSTYHASVHARTTLPSCLELQTCGLSSHVLFDLAPLYCMLKVQEVEENGGATVQPFLQTCKSSSAALAQRVSVRLKLALRANPVLRLCLWKF
jgi:hypothetical protein